jgi:hypothetical protein
MSRRPELATVLAGLVAPVLAAPLPQARPPTTCASPGSGADVPGRFMIAAKPTSAPLGGRSWRSRGDLLAAGIVRGGSVAEWPNALALKARDGQPSGGSNPSASAPLTSRTTRLACLVARSRGRQGLNLGLSWPPEQSTDPTCDVGSDGSGEVLIASRHGRVRPPHDLHDCTFRDAQEQEDGGGRVASVVQPGVPHTGGGKQVLPPLTTWTLHSPPPGARTASASGGQAARGART